MERKTRSGKVIVDIKSPAKRGRKKKSEVAENNAEQTKQPVRRSIRGRSLTDSSQLELSTEENSNLSAISIDESTKTSFTDSQSADIKLENTAENDNFYAFEDTTKTGITMKSLKIQLIDCCLQDKIESSQNSSVIPLDDDVEMKIEAVEQVEMPKDTEQPTTEQIVELKFENAEIIQEPVVKEEPVEVAETTDEIETEIEVKLEKIDDPIVENEIVALPEEKEVTIVELSSDLTKETVLKEEVKFEFAEELETSFLRRSRRLKSIYLETPTTKPEDASVNNLNASLNSPEISKTKLKGSKKPADNENTAELQVSQKEAIKVEIKEEKMEIDEKNSQEAKTESKTDDYVSQCDARLSQFITIKDNIYIKSSDKVICKVNKTMKCDCTMTEEDLKNGEMGCRYNCINRLLFIECSSKCRCGEFCDNQQFQRYNYSPINVFRTEKKGFGIRAEDDIPPESFIIEYVGEVLNNKQFDKRATKYSKDKNRHYYFMALRSNAVIDATVKGNISRFINHSCDPNAMTQKWTVNGELRVGFFSIREIKRGEEITFDYQFQRYGKEAQKCYCESTNCRGWIGENPESEDEIEVEPEDAKVKKGKPVKKIVAKKSKTKAELDKSEIENEEPNKEQELEVVEKEVKKEVIEIEKRPRKRQDLLEDLEIEEEINDLNKSGLKNRVHTIRLARLIVRAKNTDARSRLLKILISGDFPCRRLFLDYNGLRLLHSWMCDISIKSSVPDICLCIDLMNALELLPITNKTVLRDSKVLERVEKWKFIDLEKKKLTKEEKKQAKADKKKNRANKMQLDNSLEQIKTDEMQFVRTFDVLEELPTMKLILKETASELLDKWEILKEDFRIPKKQKQEIMIEHERQAGMEDWQQSNNVDSIYNDRYKNRFGEDSYAAANRSFNTSYKKTIGPVERQQRRQMYAMKIAQADLETRMKELHENNCAIFGLPATTNPMMVPARVNRVTGEYCNLLNNPVPIPPNHHNFKYEPLALSTNPDDYELPQMDLPQQWRFAIDKSGRIYYYHEKIRQPQWEPPIKLLPFAVQTECDDENEVDSDESETETEDEEEEELKELLEMLKKKKQLVQSHSVKNPPSIDFNIEEDDLEKKIMNNMISNPPDQAIKLCQLPAKKCIKKKSRRGLTSMKFIRPRTEEDKQYGRNETKRYKEVKEKLRRDKKRRLMLGENVSNMSDDEEGDSSLNESSLTKMVDELDILNKSKQLDKIRKIKKDVDVNMMLNKKKEVPVDPAKIKKIIKPVPPPIMSTADQSLIKKQFRDDIKEEITKYLLPYRDEFCINGRIVTEEDYISLINKLTFSVLTKETKHCAQSNSTLKATESVKGKTKEYIKKYMSKFEGSYQRKSDEQDYANILSKM